MRACATLLAILVGCGLALAGEGQIEIGPTTSFPIVINQPGSYLLTADLTVSSVSVNAIEIQSDNVTLDLGGHSITGSNAMSGVVAVNHTSIAIRNGAVASFVNGLWLSVYTYSNAFAVQGIRVTGCQTGIHAAACLISNVLASGNSVYGVQCYVCAITDSQAVGNAGSGFSLGLSLCKGCSSQYNEGYGFEIEGASNLGYNLLSSCFAMHNTAGPTDGGCGTANTCVDNNFN
jgi:hypothetical protein